MPGDLHSFVRSARLKINFPRVGAILYKFSIVCTIPPNRVVVGFPNNFSPPVEDHEVKIEGVVARTKDRLEKLIEIIAIRRKGVRYIEKQFLVNDHCSVSRVNTSNRRIRNQGDQISS